MNRQLAGSLLWVAVLSSCASRRPVRAAPPVCSMKLKGATLETLPPPTWLEMLVHNYDPRERRASTAPQDCTGATLVPEKLDLQCRATPAEVLPNLPRTEQTMRVEPVVSDRTLVWAPLRALENGEELGPVAWVELRERQRDRHAAVLAIGTLQIYPERVSLKVESLGDQRVLVAEGERCSDKNTNDCEREVRLLVLRGGRWFAEPVRDAKGECIGEARFPRVQTRVVHLAEGWVREFRQSSVVEVDPNEVRIHEELQVHERDVRQPGTPPRLVRRAQSDRTLRIGAQHWVSEGASLWSKIP